MAVKSGNMRQVEISLYPRKRGGDFVSFLSFVQAKQEVFETLIGHMGCWKLKWKDGGQGGQCQIKEP